jgi:MraZ protein
MEVEYRMKIEFSGNCLHTIDPKGRVTIPAAYREILSEGFTIGLNNQFQAIAIYPKEKWTEKCERLARIPESDIRGTAYVRLIMGNSFPDCELDGQGRVLLPTRIRQVILQDEKEVGVSGTGDHVRIAPRPAFDGRLTSFLETLPDTLNLIGDLTI